MVGKTTLPEMNRRKVLEKIGAISGVALFSNVAGATSSTGSRKFSGLSYDTRTHIEQATAEAELNFTKGAINGNLKVAGFNIPVGEGQKALQADSDSGRLSSYSMTLDKNKFKKNGLPLDVEFQTDGVHLVGTLTRPSGNYSRLSFTLKSKEEGGSPNLVRGALNNKQNAELSTISKTGIPQTTSISQVDNVKKSSPTEPSQELAVQPSATEAEIEVVGENGNSGIYSYNDCGTDYISNYFDYSLAHSTLEDPDYAPDVIPNGNQRMIFLHSWFESVPSNLITNSCSIPGDYEQPAPVAVDYSVKSPNLDETDLESPYPQESSSESSLNNWVNGALSIAQSLLGSWTGLGSTLIKFALRSGSTSDITTQTNRGLISKEYVWSIDLDMDSLKAGIPKNRDAASTVRCQLVNGNLSSGQQTDITITSEFTFQYPSHETTCPCSYVFVNGSAYVEDTVTLTVG